MTEKEQMIRKLQDLILTSYDKLYEACQVACANEKEACIPLFTFEFLISKAKWKKQGNELADNFSNAVNREFFILFKLASDWVYREKQMNIPLSVIGKLIDEKKQFFLKACNKRFNSK